MGENSYTAKDIVVLSGPLGIRKRPAMYIGSTGGAGFLHLIYEVIDNAVDEAMAGYCHNITIKLTKEGEVDVAEVSDDGRGIPVDIIPKVNRPALEVVFTSLHSGAKFDNKIYKVAGGLHGVGLTVVNALSEYTEVTVKKDGKIYRLRFSRGMPTSQIEVIGESPETGTTVRFKPDMEIFSVKSFDGVLLSERLKSISYLSPGLRIRLRDERGDQPREEEFYSSLGLIDFITNLRRDREQISKPIAISKEADSTKIQISLQYVKSFNEELLSFVNKIKTTEGGTHVTGFRAGLTRAITNYVEKRVKRQNLPTIEGEDTREGLIAIISLMMQNPEFEGQTKEKLGNTTIKQIVENAIYSGLSDFLEENPLEAQKIVGVVLRAADAREAARRARELSRKKNLLDSGVLPGKLADCTETDPEKAELFIVEGESPAGSSKQGRDRMYQAVLPLRGKILNVEKASEERILNNEELRALVAALGTGTDESFNITKLRYKKIIFLADADVDGSHINTLLLTFFYNKLRPLIVNGNVYIAQPPLYRISKGKEITYAYSDAQLKELVGNNSKVAVQRYKGLGEMNPDQLWETTMDPKRRVLKKISIKDAELADELFRILMGMDVEPRRRFIEEHSTEVSFLDV